MTPDRAAAALAAARVVAAERGLIVDHVYDVHITDCCAHGILRVGRYLGPVMQADRPGDEVLAVHTGWRFDAGTIGPEWGQLEFVEVTPPPKWQEVPGHPGLHWQMRP